MEEKLKQILAQLDPANANHWTAEGLPRIETVRMLAGHPGLTREELTAVDPAFNRQAAEAAKAGAKPAAVPAVPAAPADPVLAPAATQEAAPDMSKEKEDALVKAHREAVVKMDQLREAKAKLDQEFEDARVLVDKLSTQLDARKAPAHVSLMHDILAYQKAQEREAMEKAGRVAKLRQLEIKPEDLLGKSPLDAALARKRQQTRAA